MKHRRYHLLLAALLILLVLASGWTHAQEATRIQFVIDSSLSMMSTIKGETRMDIAKDVLQELVKELERQDGLEIGLRVYGSGLTDLFGCRDSVLFHEFAPVCAIREPILETVDALEPRGVTPIGYSLLQAAEDFAALPPGRNVIVLITDGQESCQADPCVISQELQTQGVMLTPFVVGFDMGDRESEFVRCIGTYYEADDRETLKTALEDIIATIAHPPVLEVAVWGQGSAITEDVRLVAVHSSGQETDVTPLVRSSPWASIAGLQPGSYSLRAVWILGPQSYSRDSHTFTLRAGETTPVEIDFGAMLGGLTVIAKAGGVDVSDKIQINLSSTSGPATAAWQGMPPRTSLGTGLYVITASLHDDPQPPQSASAFVEPDGETVVVLEFDELPAELKVDVVYRGEDISDLVVVDVRRAGCWLGQITAGEVFSATAGEVSLVVGFDEGVPITKNATGIVLVSGEMTHVLIDMGEVVGTLRVVLEADEMDVTAAGTVRVRGYHNDGHEYTRTLPQSGGLKEAVLPVGPVYAVGSYDGRQTEATALVIRGGEVVDAVLSFPRQGTVRLVPLVNGNPAPISQIEAHLWQDAMYVGQLSPADQSFSISVLPGEYQLEVMYLTSPEQVQNADQIAVLSGEDTVVAMDFSASGELQASAWTGTSPFSHMQYVEVQRDSQPVLRLIRQQRDGNMWYGSLLAGTYDLRFVPSSALRMDDVWLRDVQIEAGQFREVDVQFAGVGVLEAAVTVAGEPLADTSAPRVYPAGTTSNSVQLYREGSQADGIWTRTLVEGLYDVEVNPNVRGVDPQWLYDVEVAVDETTTIAFEFGETSVLQLVVLADGEPFGNTGAPRVFVTGETRQLTQLNRSGSRDEGRWSRELPAGEYDIRVSSNVRGMDDIFVTGIELLPGRTTVVDASFGGAGTLELVVFADGEPFGDIAAPRVFGTGETRQLTQLNRSGSRDEGRWSRELSAGEYDLSVSSNVRGMEDIFVSGIVIAAGATERVTVEFPGAGTLQIQVLHGGQPLANVNRVNAYIPGESRALAQLSRVGRRDDGIWGRDLPAGVYDVEIITRDHGTQWLHGIEIESREQFEVTVTVPN